MEALLQAAEEDTREDPLFDDPDDLDYDEDMAQLMREVYSAFKSEVSGADLRADASKLALAQRYVGWFTICGTR